MNIDTVIAFHEDIHYENEYMIPEGEDVARWRREELKSIRANTLKVLRQLSLCGLQEDKRKIMQLTAVRHPLLVQRSGTTALSPMFHGLEVSSHLFYYLFEDFSAANAVLNTFKLRLDDIASQL